MAGLLRAGPGQAQLHGAVAAAQAPGIERDFQITRPCCHWKIAAGTTIGNYLIPHLLASGAAVIVRTLRI